MRTGGAGSRGRGRSGGSQPPFRLEAQRAGVPWSAVIKWLAILGVAGAALVAATAAFVFWMYGRDPNLPEYQTLADYHPKQVTVISDGNDRRIGEIYSERRTVVPYDKVPPIVVDAFVAAEDNSFWTHRGVDYWGMFRALITNLRAGHTRQGASTITQQVVKTFLLTPERTFRRKIQEIILARRLESSLTKQEIMTLYMNQIYFGHGRYGVEEAARFYFGKHVGELNIGEAAMLAGLPQSPENISPRKNPKRAKERQTYVLNQLAAMQKITVAEAQKWIDAPIRVVERPFPELGSAPEWVDLARRELVKRYNADEAALDKAGATVRTTLDPSLQAVAQKALQSGLRAIDKRHGIGRPVRNVKPDKIEAEIAKLARRLPRGGPVAKEIYDAVVTHVSDDDRELVIDLGDHPAAILLGGEDDARFNPPDADGKTRSPSERFKPGDVVSVMLAATPAARPAGKPADKAADKAADDDDEARPAKAAAAPKHARQRAVFAPGPEGAVVIIDLKARKVRALIGGYAPKVGGFDRATMAHRQPGSSFKPYLYAAAIDSGKYTPASVLNDVPQSFDKIDPSYRPKNYETGRYDGPVRLRYALSRSINSISLELAYNLQPETVVAFAKKMGIASELKPDLSIALGSHEVTPFEHTNAVATLATGGIAAPAQFIDAIDGKRLPAPAGEQVLRPEVAYVVADMMRSVVTEGTAATAGAALKIPIAGKTGTSNEAKDTWFVGLTPDYAIGVWIGYDDPRPMPRETGGSNAVPVYIDIMKQLNPPAKAFPRPPHVVEATIDKQTGLLAPEGAPKQTTLTEVFVEGTQPTEVAPMPGDVTEDNKTKGEYED
ncbi:MAG TPA: PBP1A family penicillin-binding protein [Kofleriaceae bacterium]|nr:PBP1A family penicillin-binding protein [Kofleriaceae bacterium]